MGEFKIKSGWDLETLEDAQEHAKEATTATGELHIATDSGAHCHPRYNVTRAPAVGDTVSYGFNGDYYPCGEIVKISPTMKKITTSTGDTFYRRRNTATWLRHKTWALIHGHHDERNPHF